MRFSRPIRHVVATGAAVGLAAAIAGLPAGGAYAGVKAQYAAAGSASADYVGSGVGGSCDLTAGTDNPQTTPVTFSDGTKKASVVLDATYTNNLNSGDTVHVKGHVDTKLTVDKFHKNLRSFDFGAGGSLTLVHSVSTSDCAGNGSVFGESIMQFTETKKGYFYLTRDTGKPNSVSIFALVNLKNGNLKTLDFYEGDKSHATSRVLLKPGKYGIELMQVGFALSDSGGIILKSGAPLKRAVSLTTTLHGEFKPKN
ncbi:MAG TPA: hypothetical protein VHR35_13640 [Nocardioides sp.]|jgi:hypothetical protein|nr:hypothetical protein [Nocardioides sp.]